MTNAISSNVLQQFPLHPHPAGVLSPSRVLDPDKPGSQFPRRPPCPHHHVHDPLRPLLPLHLIHIGLVRPRHILHHLLHGRRLEQASDCIVRSGVFRCAHDSGKRGGHRRRFRERDCVCASEDEAGEGTSRHSTRTESTGSSNRLGFESKYERFIKVMRRNL